MPSGHRKKAGRKALRKECSWKQVLVKWGGGGLRLKMRPDLVGHVSHCKIVSFYLE